MTDTHTRAARSQRADKLADRAARMRPRSQKARDLRRALYAEAHAIREALEVERVSAERARADGFAHAVDERPCGECGAVEGEDCRPYCTAVPEPIAQHH